MSDDMLSQDEINALLMGQDFTQEDTEEPSLDEYLTPMEQDALGEIGNISFGSSATALSTLLNQKVDITTPTVSVIKREDIEKEFPIPYVAVQVSYTEGFKATNSFVIEQSDAAIIVDLMMGGDGTNPSTEFGEMQLSAVQEAMNQMMGSSATSMSTIFSKKVDISPPNAVLFDVKEGTGMMAVPDDAVLVKVSFDLKIGNLIDSQVMQMLPVEFAKELVRNLMDPSGSVGAEPVKKEEPAPVAQATQQPMQQQYQQPPMQQPMQQQYQQPPMQQPMQQQYQQQQYQDPAAMYGYGQPAAYPQGPPMYTQQMAPNHYGTYTSPQSHIQPVAFANFEPTPLENVESKNLNMLLDIPLQVTVELGRTRRSVQDILNLSSGAIIELDKLAGEPVDILVNNKLVAKGEVVVIEENFGVRVTDIISQSDRLKKLR